MKKVHKAILKEGDKFHWELLILCKMHNKIFNGKRKYQWKYVTCERCLKMRIK